MVKITNGSDTFEVTKGAFDEIFSRQGFIRLQAESKSEDDAENSKIRADEEFCEVLEEKPLSQWSKSEVKKYALIKHIDISGTKNVNEAKKRISFALRGE